MAPRWLTVSGIAVAAMLLFSLHVTQWIGLLFPVWVLVVSLYILVAARRADAPALLSAPEAS